MAMVSYKQTKSEMTKAQFLAKHKARFDKEGLPKSARTARYASYLQGRGNNRGQKSRQKSSNMTVNQNSALTKVNRRYLEQSSMGGRNRAVDRIGNNRNSRTRFSDCALTYAQAVIDPWSVKTPPCVPDMYNIPSWKFGSRSRGSFQIGTMGVGYLIVNPYAIGNTTSVAYGTTGAFNTAAFGSVAETNTTQIFGTTPFAPSIISTTNCQYRVVGCGVAVRWIGSELNRSGQMILYRDPNNGTPVGGATASILLLNTETTTVPMDREWHFINWKPVSANDYEYNTSIGTTFPLLLLVAGSIVNQGIEFDIVQWFEMSGQALPNMTPTDSDPIGMAIIRSAMGTPQSPDSPKEAFERFLQSAGRIADSTLSIIGKGAPLAIKGATILQNVGLL
jgi:hypothetical protein